MIGFTEMFVDQGQKFPCNVGGHVLAEGRVEPNNISVAVSQVLDESKTVLLDELFDSRLAIEVGNLWRVVRRCVNVQ